MTLISIFCNFFYLSLLFVLSCNLRFEAKPICSDSGYIPGSQFDSNRQKLFSELRNNTPRYRFYNVSIGSKPDEVIFGMALCRNDTTDEHCGYCLDAIFVDISTNCQNPLTARTWYWSCMVRYSNKNFFSVANTTTSGVCILESSMTEQNTDGLNATVTVLLTNLSSVAANSSRLFAAGMANFIGHSNTTKALYGLAQCTWDISADDCYRCLMNNKDELVSTKCNKASRGARIYGENCNLWYNDTNFYNGQLLAISTTNDSTTNYAANNGGGKTGLIAGVVAGVSVVLIIIGVFIYCILKRCTKGSSSSIEISSDNHNGGEVETNDIEMMQPGTRVYSIKELEVATESFSPSKKLGEGGYGVVFKATLIDGMTVAVKRFKAWRVDIENLKKELSLVVNIEHPNILKLLGYCFGKDQYSFVYEYMQNGSLNRYFKDPTMRQNLNWQTRFDIIKGIADGLSYLHNLERKIIHGDLKLENILLSDEMKAKIADFDLLRQFELDQTHQSTDRGYGTYGYMAPEVALNPRKRYSVKSDVYSFGIMLLEIVTGEKIHTFGKTEVTHPDLISFVWHHWNRKTPEEVIDTLIDFHGDLEQIVRCIQVGLLCIQHTAAERPDMLQVLYMLTSRSPLPAPSLHGFHRDATEPCETVYFALL